MLYAHESLKVKIINFGIQYDDLPMLSCEVSLGMEKKSIVNFFYCEFMGGVSGLSDLQSQHERLSRMINVWKLIYDRNRDTVCLGDANVCGFRWAQEDYQYKDLGDLIQSFLLETSSCQLVRDYTRSR